MSQNPFAECRDLVKMYEAAGVETVALQHLDMEVAPGELLAVIGPGGSGKTTLVNILGGLDRPSAGQVWVDGQNLSGLSNAGLARYRRAKVGFVWQHSARNLVPYLTALENVELPMALAGRGAPRRDLAGKLLERVGLGGERHSHPAYLSIEHRQRVAIAAAVANGPKLVLADEPTGELDGDAAREILLLLRRFVEQEAVTMVVATHDASVADYADTVLALKDGQIV